MATDDILSFSEIIKRINKGNYVCDANGLIFQFLATEKTEFLFFSDYVYAKIGEVSEKIDYDGFSRFSVTFADEIKTNADVPQASAKGGLGFLKKISATTINTVSKALEDNTEKSVSILFDGKEVLSTTKAKGTELYDLLKLLAKYFTDKTLCSPAYELQQKVTQSGVASDDTYNPLLCTFFLQYSERFEDIMANSLLESGSTVIAVLAENSATIADNIGQTVKKNLNVKSLLGGGMSGIIGSAVNVASGVAMAVADRAVQNALSKAENIIILTDKNVILGLKDEISACTFEEAEIFLRKKDDETLANVVDIYNEDDIKLLDNVGEEAWIQFRKKLRNLKKQNG